MQIISREEAKKQGFFRYFNGKPCKKGHISQKYVSNMGCVECANIKINLWIIEKYTKRNMKNLD